MIARMGVGNLTLAVFNLPIGEAYLDA